MCPPPAFAYQPGERTRRVSRNARAHAPPPSASSSRLSGGGVGGGDGGGGGGRSLPASADADPMRHTLVLVLVTMPSGAGSDCSSPLPSLAQEWWEQAPLTGWPRRAGRPARGWRWQCWREACVVGTAPPRCRVPLGRGREENVSDDSSGWTYCASVGGMGAGGTDGLRQRVSRRRAEVVVAVGGRFADGSFACAAATAVAAAAAAAVAAVTATARVPVADVAAWAVGAQGRVAATVGGWARRRGGGGSAERAVNVGARSAHPSAPIEALAAPKRANVCVAFTPPWHAPSGAPTTPGGTTLSIRAEGARCASCGAVLTPSRWGPRRRAARPAGRRPTPPPPSRLIDTPRRGPSRPRRGSGT